MSIFDDFGQIWKLRVTVLQELIQFEITQIDKSMVGIGPSLGGSAPPIPQWTSVESDLSSPVYHLTRAQTLQKPIQKW